MPTADRWRALEPWKTVLGAAIALSLSRHDVPQGDPSAPTATKSPTASRYAPEGSVANAPQAPAPPEDVLWAGCAEVRLSPQGQPRACTLLSDDTVETATLRLWLPSRVTEPAVTLDGTPIAGVDAAKIEDGTSLLVQPGHGGRLAVSGTVEGHVLELLALDVDFRPKPDKELRAELDGAVGDEADQRALEQRLRDELEQELPRPRRLLLTRYLQYVLFDLGEHRKSLEQAQAAVALARAQGEPLIECDVAWAASYMQGELLGDNSAALDFLQGQGVCQYHASIPKVAMMGSYYEGVLEQNLGRFTHARRSLQRAAQIARRLRWPRWEIIALNSLVEVLANQGRFGWARQVLTRMHELDAVERDTGLLDRCKGQALYHRKLGDLARREAELVGVASSVAREHWLEARAIYRDGTRCPAHPTVEAQLATLDLELARAALEAGALDQAQDIIDALPRDALTPIADARRRLLRAELALERGDPRAAARILQDFAADHERGELAEAPEVEEWWRFHLLRARTHQERGDLQAALEALARARAQLDVDRRTLGAETDRSAAMRRTSSQLLVRLLLEHGQEHAALCAARIARARGLTSLAPVPARARQPLQAVERTRAELFEGYEWYDPSDIPVDERMKLEAQWSDFEATLPVRASPVECGELPSPRAGEASLLLFDDGLGLVGFGWRDDGHVVVRRLPSVAQHESPEALAEALLSPLASVWHGATRLRVLAPATMHAVSFADLPWQGRALGDRLAVVHGLDLPPVPLQERREGTAALVFSDPSKALMGRYDALAERFERWKGQLAEHDLQVGLTVDPSGSPAHPSVEETLEGLRGVELALLYGFGAIRPTVYDLLPSSRTQHEPDQAGFGIGADVLTRSDILLEAGLVPRHVILAHCDSATIDEYGVSGAIGLAQSYVQAGSEWAVGAVGSVAPESMEVIVDALLEAELGRVDDVAVALQRAKQRLREAGLPDGEQLRLWVL